MASDTIKVVDRAQPAVSAVYKNTDDVIAKDTGSLTIVADTSVADSDITTLRSTLTSNSIKVIVSDLS